MGQRQNRTAVSDDPACCSGWRGMGPGRTSISNLFPKVPFLRGSPRLPETAKTRHVMCSTCRAVYVPPAAERSPPLRNIEKCCTIEERCSLLLHMVPCSLCAAVLTVVTPKRHRVIAISVWTPIERAHNSGPCLYYSAFGRNLQDRIRKGKPSFGSSLLKKACGNLRGRAPKPLPAGSGILIPPRRARPKYRRLGVRRRPGDVPPAAFRRNAAKSLPNVFQNEEPRQRKETC
jgi:hypothetical protein